MRSPKKIQTKQRWSPDSILKMLEKNKNIVKLAKIKQYEMEKVRLAKLLREVNKKLKNLKM
jgi:hypothetical protein